MVLSRESVSDTAQSTPLASVGATGWVRNEYDGSVSMEIQGTESQIDQVILAIERGTYVHIENMDVRTIPLVEGEHGFRAVAY